MLEGFEFEQTFKSKIMSPMAHFTGDLKNNQFMTS